MPAAPHTAAPAQHPDPPQDRAHARTLRLLSLVRTLIAFGQNFATTLRERPSSFTVFDIACRFRTTDVALILARITRGLRLAMALQARLEDRAAHPLPVRTPGPPFPQESSRESRAKTRASRQPATNAVLAALPTAEEIAEHLRTRPIHAVLIDICDDLGVFASDPMGSQLIRVLIENGAYLAFFRSARKPPRLTNLFPPDMPLSETIRLRMPEPSLTSTAPGRAVPTGPP